MAVGQADPAGLANTDFGLVRYTPDGQLDPAFGAGGKLVSDVSGHDDLANAVAIQPDGKIVAVGATDQDAVLARYLADGTLDPTLGNGGTVVGGINTNEVRGVAIAPNGTIFVAGTRSSAAIVASYGSTGTLSSGFGTSGIAEADLSSGFDSGDDLVVEPSGDIVLVGTASSTTVSDMALVRFRPDGTLDTSVVADLSGFGDFGHALAIDAQGRIVAAGSANGQFGLMRAFL